MRAPQRVLRNNNVSSPRARLRHLHKWETRLHPVYGTPGSEDPRGFARACIIKAVTFAGKADGKKSARKNSSDIDQTTSHHRSANRSSIVDVSYRSDTAGTT